MAYILLVSLILLIIYINRIFLSRSSHWYSFLKPEVLVSLLYVYYAIIGPIIIYEDESSRGRADMSTYTIGLLAALLSFVCVVIGTKLSKLQPFPIVLPQANSKNSSSLFYINSLLLFAIGLFAFLLGFSGNITSVILNLFGGNKENISIIENTAFLFLAINAFIPCVISAFISMKIDQGYRLYFVLTLITSFAVFIAFGFRYRIAIVLLSILISNICISRKKPPIARLAVFAIAAFFLFAIIGLSRSYFRGLNLDNLYGLNLWDLLVAGFKDSSVFWTSSQLIDTVPSITPHVGITPFMATFASLVPRSIWQDKNLYEYMLTALTPIYGSEENIGGAAILFYGEQYLMFGWLGIFIGSTILGILLQWLWRSLVISNFNLYSIYIYSTSLPCLYIYFSRGYLPLAFMLSASTIIPCFLIRLLPGIIFRRS